MLTTKTPTDIPDYEVPYSFFDEVLPRRGTDSYKWDSAENPDVLPMWVADMDFRTAPAIIEALHKRVEHGIFGYTRVPEEFYKSTIDWFRDIHNWVIDRNAITYTSGVVPALSAIIKALSTPGDKIIVQTPVYNCFFSSIRNNSCEVLPNPLKCVDNRYIMDYEDLEAKARDPKAKLLLLCNPHNPVGRVWDKEELSRLHRICADNGILVISDEIHCELTFPGIRYTPFATIDDSAIVCCSPSKAFNIAGLQIANIIANDVATRAAIDKAININEVCDVNPFGVIALIAAYRHGQGWLKTLRRYLYDNYTSLRSFFDDNLPQLPVTRMEGTYLAWTDFHALAMSSDDIEEFLLKEHRLWLNAGTMYGCDGYMRINMACPRALLMQGLNRLSGALAPLLSLARH